MHLLSGFADISVAQLLLVAIVALLAGIIGGISGYGSGALMPLVLKRQAVVRAVSHVSALEPQAAPLRQKMDELRPVEIALIGHARR